MVNLTFGEQVKIILSRKGMTIKELAEKVQERTGKNMSRQNMTQRLGRDNFQEQDMRLIAEILGCSFRLSIMEQDEAPAVEREVTVGELVGEPEKKPVQEPEKIAEKTAAKSSNKRIIAVGRNVVKERKKSPVEEQVLGERNPYTGKEYQTNSVRMHPKRIGYVQVYDQQQHAWTDMTEWAFLGYQERKKRLLGKDYEPPIYLD